MSDPVAPPPFVEPGASAPTAQVHVPHVDSSETRRGHAGEGGQKTTQNEVSAIIANANSELARKAKAYSATLAATDAAAQISVHNARVGANASGHHIVDNEITARNPDTPPEKEDPPSADVLSKSASLDGDENERGKQRSDSVRRRGLPDGMNTAQIDLTSDGATPSAMNTTNDRTPAGRGLRHKKRRLMADGSFALEPREIAERSKERLPDGMGTAQINVTGDGAGTSNLHSTNHTIPEGRGLRHKKRRLMADGSFALEPREIAERSKETSAAAAGKPNDARLETKTHAPGFRPEIQSTTPQADVVSTPLGPPITFSMHALETGLDDQSRRRAIPPGLESDKIPSRDDFSNALINFRASQNLGPLRQIVFNKALVDLYVVFREVQVIGGYDSVCLEKKWKKVASALGRDLSTATSAGHSMRNIYEKNLLDFGKEFLGVTRCGGVEPGEFGQDGRSNSRSISIPNGVPNNDGDSDVDDDTLENLRLALRFQQADLFKRLQERDRNDELARKTGNKPPDESFQGFWLSFGGACPLFDDSRAVFANELPDLEVEKPRWAQCRLCRGWRDLGEPNAHTTRRPKEVKRALPRSERARAQMERERAGVPGGAAHVETRKEKEGYRPGARLGLAGRGTVSVSIDETDLAQQEGWIFRKASVADLAAAARDAAAVPSSSRRAATEGDGLTAALRAPSAVDTLAAAATAIVTEALTREDNRPETLTRDKSSRTLEAMAQAAMFGIGEEDREMFDTAEAKRGMHDAFHKVVEAVVHAFAATKVPIPSEVAGKTTEVAQTETETPKCVSEPSKEDKPKDKPKDTPKDVPMKEAKNDKKTETVDEKVAAAEAADAETAQVMALAFGAAASQRVVASKVDTTVTAPLVAASTPTPSPPKPSGPEPAEAADNETESPPVDRVIELRPAEPLPPKPRFKFVIKKPPVPVFFTMNRPGGGGVGGKPREVAIAGNDDADAREKNNAPREPVLGGVGRFETNSEKRCPKIKETPDGTPHGPPEELCACVPRVPEGWHRWDALRKKQNPNGTWAADCYYRTPTGPDGKWKTFILRSEEEICQFLKADAAQEDGGVFCGLGMDFFNCKPFTRKTTFTTKGTDGGDPFAAGGAVTHKWRAEMVAPLIETRGIVETRDVNAAHCEGELSDESGTSDDDDDIVEDVAQTDSDDEKIAKVVEGPVWYD